jgi:DNA polymerase I-like protein with 3'-5' exonuclease and polymerase domains
LNPGSTPQVASLLFERWNLPVRVWTAGGEPSTDDATLRGLLTTPGLDDRQRATIVSIRDYRYAVKLRGTYVTKVLPIGMEVTEESLAWDEEESFEERQERWKKDRKKHGVVLEDGRVHPDYNPSGTVGWRLSSSNPNAQNWPRKVRDMVAAEKGHVIVGADMDQLELRFAAALAGAKMYLDAFDSGGDPHAVTCRMLYGAQFDRADESKRKALRDFGKRFSYAVLYRAEDEKVQEVITSTEDDDGRLLYANLSLRDTSALRQRWLDGNPEIKTWWESEIAEWYKQGYLVEPVLGQRIDFLDGEKGENVEGRIVNFKCQSGGSALVHLATMDLLDAIPFGKWGPGTGLIQQGHDALEVEVPCEHERWNCGACSAGCKHTEFGWCPPGCGCEANKTARLLEEVMRRDGRKYGLPVTFTASAKIRRRWHEPKGKP